MKNPSFHLVLLVCFHETSILVVLCPVHKMSTVTGEVKTVADVSSSTATQFESLVSLRYCKLHSAVIEQLHYLWFPEQCIFVLTENQRQQTKNPKTVVK